MKVRGFKNLGEAESVCYCTKDKDSVFVTDDCGAIKNSESILGNRSVFFISLLIDIAQDYLTQKQLLQILEERHKQRKLRKKIYCRLKDKIKNKEEWKNGRT